MLLLAVLLLSSVPCFSQPSFPPIRIDDGRPGLFFYPKLYDAAGEDVLVTWAVQADSFVGTFGQSVSPAGLTVGAIETYQELEFGDYLCPPELSLVELSGGGSVQLILHN